MFFKSQLLTDDRNKNEHTAIETTSGLNRRQFLRRVGISAGTAALATQGVSQYWPPALSTLIIVAAHQG